MMPSINLFDAVSVGAEHYRFAVETVQSNDLLSKIISIPKLRQLKKVETIIQAMLKNSLGGEAEISTPFGRIDLLTNDKIIEIKESKQWKSAIGQVLSYQKFYPEKIATVILFGKREPMGFEDIKDWCKKINIDISYVDFCLDRSNNNYAQKIIRRSDIVKCMDFLVKYQDNPILSKLWDECEIILLASLTPLENEELKKVFSLAEKKISMLSITDPVMLERIHREESERYVESTERVFNDPIINFNQS